MTKNTASSRQLKIVVPYFYIYYLFDYLRHLVPTLRDDGFHVTVITADPRVSALFADEPGIVIEPMPRILRFLNNRGANPVFRVGLWLAGWIWGWTVIRWKFDFVILPFDNKPLWYILSAVLPSLSCHNTTELIDPKITLERDALEQPPGIMFAILAIIDRLSGARLFPRWRGALVDGQYVRQRPGTIVNYFIAQRLLIDRICGYWSQNFYCGFSRIDFLTVTGHEIKKNYIAMGLDPRKAVVTGNPGYDHLYRLRDRFSQEKRAAFRKDLNIPQDSRLFTFFLSPSSFTQTQIDEVVGVAKEICDQIPDGFMAIKFHPKTRRQDPPRFREQLEAFTDRFILITEFLGEEYNAKLMLCSYCIIQKQSSVGLMAIFLRVPIISYNIFDTDYEDDQYAALDASIRVESFAEMRALLIQATKTDVFTELEQRQADASTKFCIATDSANQNIADLIRNHLEGCG